MSCCNNQTEYYDYLRSLGGFPLGFKASVSSFTFLPLERPSEEPYRMNMAAVAASEPCRSFAGVFTKNAVPGAPVRIGRERLEKEFMRGILVNNRISNVAARGGRAAALRLTAAAESILGIESGSLFPSSTGIIGWQLPEQEMLKALPDLLGPLRNDGTQMNARAAREAAEEAEEAGDDRARSPESPRSPESSDALLKFARAIMTTDSFPKIRVRELGRGRIVAVAKGAGMIEPNMATMLGFIFTDLDVPRDALREILKDAVDVSFNRISVDSDQSTSDMVLAFSSGKFGVELEDFRREFTELCRDLSMDIVRNGEGTAHVMDIEVCGSADRDLSREIGKAVGNSPLVKTAVYGNDPNVGRILSAVGDYLGNKNLQLDGKRLSIFIGGEMVFSQGVFHLDKEKEEILSGYLKERSQNPRVTGYPQHDRCVHIKIDLGESEQPAVSGGVHVYASDLGHEYVHENADYRS